MTLIWHKPWLGEINLSKRDIWCESINHIVNLPLASRARATRGVDIIACGGCGSTAPQLQHVPSDQNVTRSACKRQPGVPQCVPMLYSPGRELLQPRQVASPILSIFAGTRALLEDCQESRVLPCTSFSTGTSYQNALSVTNLILIDGQSPPNTNGSE